MSTPQARRERPISSELQRAAASLFVLAVAAVPAVAAAQPVAPARVQAVVADGDVIFHESRSAQSKAVRAATGSRYSHMGLVLGVADGRPFVLEAVQPVKATPLVAWIRRGRAGHFVLMRLARPLQPDERRALRAEAERFLGRDYDPLFEWSDVRIYCSELVWKAFERALGLRLGEPQPWRTLRLTDARVRALAQKRLGHLPDLEAPVITPAAMMGSPLLVSVLAGELR